MARYLEEVSGRVARLLNQRDCDRQAVGLLGRQWTGDKEGHLAVTVLLLVVQVACGQMGYFSSCEH